MLTKIALFAAAALFGLPALALAQPAALVTGDGVTITHGLPAASPDRDGCHDSRGVVKANIVACADRYMMPTATVEGCVIRVLENGLKKEDCSAANLVLTPWPGSSISVSDVIAHIDDGGNVYMRMKS